MIDPSEIERFDKEIRKEIDDRTDELVKMLKERSLLSGRQEFATVFALIRLGRAAQRVANRRFGQAMNRLSDEQHLTDRHLNN